MHYRRVVAEGRMDRLGQLTNPIRLGDEPCRAVGQDPFHRILGAEPARQQDRHLGIDVAEPAIGFASVDTGHDHIEDDERYRLLGVPDERERVLTAPECPNPITVGLENLFPTSRRTCSSSTSRTSSPRPRNGSCETCARELERLLDDLVEIHRLLAGRRFPRRR